MKIGGEVPLKTTNNHKKKKQIGKQTLKRAWGGGRVVMVHKSCVNRIKMGMGCKVGRTNILIKRVLLMT
jgi:hypothetical protein